MIIRYRDQTPYNITGATSNHVSSWTAETCAHIMVYQLLADTLQLRGTSVKTAGGSPSKHINANDTRSALAQKKSVSLIDDSV